MKKTALLAFVLVLLLPMTVVIHFSAPVKAEGETWTVDDDGPADFRTIQEAINAASPGDTVFVYNGTYQEWNIGLDKDNLSLIGENKDGTVIDGSNHGWILIITAQNVTVTGFTIQKSPIGTAGVFLNNATKSKIGNNILKNHDSGIYARFSNGNVIENNWVANNNEGIILSRGCKENKIRGNSVTGNTLSAGVNLKNGAHDNEVENNSIVQNTHGISISFDDNSIFGNQIIKNGVGIYEYSEPTHGYKIFHNNLINNTKQVDLGNSSVNAWDNGLEGNYWSDYNGTDFNWDGIGDTSYIINGNNTDHYPLMGTFSDFPVTLKEETYHVTTICNSTISEFQFNDVGKTINFNVTGPDDSLGFCRVTIPNIIVQDLWEGNYIVLVDGEEPVMMNNWTDGTYTYIYFTYVHSTHDVMIIPEFPMWASMLLILIVLTVAIALYKRRLLKTPIH